METKVCNICGIEKEVNEFYKSKNGKYGVDSKCKICKSKQNKQRRWNSKGHKIWEEKMIVNELFNKGFKICNTCNKTKKLSEYFKNYDGYRYDCKQCNLIKTRKYQTLHPEKVKQYATKNRNKNREQRRYLQRLRMQTLRGKFSQWKTNAKDRGLIWELTLSELESRPKICYYTGEDLTLEPNHFNSISLDRIDSNKGYIKDNVVFCCKIVNFMKLDSNLQDFMFVCEKIVKNKENILTLNNK